MLVKNAQRDILGLPVYRIMTIYNKIEKTNVYSNLMIDTGMPEYWIFHLLNYCNCKCVYCLQGNEKWLKTQRKMFMPYELIEKMTPYFKSARIISLTSLCGEPTLHPNLKEIICDIRENNNECDMIMGTNFKDLFTDDFIKLLISKRVNIGFSFDFADKELYEKYRVGAIYENVVSNLIKIKELKEKNNSSFPYLAATIVCSQEAIDSITDTIRFLIPYIQALNIQKMSGTAKSYDLNENIKKEILDIINDAGNFRLVGNAIEDIRPLLGYKDDCLDPFKSLCIMYDGKIGYCPRAIIGDLTKKDFLEIWNNRKIPTICERCTVKNYWFWCI